MIYLDSEDATYFFGVIGILSVVELTAAMLVLSTPFTPKVLASLGHSPAFASLRSWAISFRTSSWGSGGKDSAGTASSTIKGSARRDKVGGPYLEVDEQPLATTITAPARGTTHFGDDATGITRVTDFRVENEFNTAYPVSNDSFEMANLPSRRGEV